MIRQEIAGRGIVLEGPSPSEGDARCKVCGQPLPNWRPGMPLICPDHNPNRRGPRREGEQLAGEAFDAWIRSTLWYVAAP